VTRSRESKRTASGTLPKVSASAVKLDSEEQPAALESGVLPVLRLDQSSEREPSAHQAQPAAPRSPVARQVPLESRGEKRVMRARARHDLAPARTVQRIQPAARAEVQPAPSTRERPRALALAGIALVALFWVQAGLGLSWPTLAHWQTLENFKMVTGAVLLLFVASQWLLTLARLQNWSGALKLAYTWHQRLGVLAPLLLFAHTIRLGFGYQLILSSVFLGTCLLGLVSPRAFPGLRRLSTPWLILHIAFSVTTVALIAYHVWIALAFE
jgi:methionine sulfoxide reductase heme-binding subunit